VIHSVVNPLAIISGAIHVYDGNFFGFQRSMWDAETLVEQPHDINAVARGMPVQSEA
jgi:predicted metal-dependent enzyme (double-stranded beta helix superfamily)